MNGRAPSPLAQEETRAAGPATLDLPLKATGRHWVALRVPWSHDESGYGQVVVPVAAVIGEAPGPTALLTAGVHGDEYEGQIALAELARTFDPAEVRGRVLIVPTANPPAARAGLRTSPVDGGNLARLFPGDPAGGITAQLAEGFSRLLLPEADIVLDLHGGGRSMEYLPCAWGRLPEGRALAEKVIAALLAFGAPLAAVAQPAGNGGTLVATALAMGKVALAAEIGGGGSVRPATMALARAGIKRVLRHAGILKDAPAGSPSRLLVTRPDHFLRSPAPGWFEPFADLGDTARAGEAAGLLHDPERPGRPPEPLVWPASGLVLCRRVPVRVDIGDVVAHLAADVGAEDLLAGLAV